MYKFNNARLDRKFNNRFEFILTVKISLISLLQKHFKVGIKVKQYHGVNRKRSNYPRYIYQDNTVNYTVNH